MQHGRRAGGTQSSKGMAVCVDIPRAVRTASSARKLSLGEGMRFTHELRELVWADTLPLAANRR